MEGRVKDVEKCPEEQVLYQSRLHHRHGVPGPFGAHYHHMLTSYFPNLTI